MRNGIDLSNYSGQPNLTALASVVNSQNISHIVIACQFESTYQGWAPLVQQLGCTFDAYLYLYGPQSEYYPGYGYAEQVQKGIANFGAYRPGILWLDIEDQSYPAPGDPEEAIASAEQSAVTPGIYTRKGYWLSIGNPQLGSRVPLWDAGYGAEPQTPADLAVEYGGWLRCRGRQWQGEFTSYGLTFGLDSWSE